MTAPNLSYEQLQTFLAELNISIQRVKVQTGELKETREQIVTIDRALRGHNGEPGLIGRFIGLEKSLTNLVEKQIPEMLITIHGAVKSVDDAKDQLQVCQLHHEAKTQHVSGEIARLRDDYLKHLEDERKERERENKEEEKFGGREWFRANASALFIGMVTLVINAAVMWLIISRVFPTP
jgi:hypothetical protein